MYNGPFPKWNAEVSTKNGRRCITGFFGGEMLCKPSHTLNLVPTSSRAPAIHPFHLAGYICVLALLFAPSLRAAAPNGLNAESRAPEAAAIGASLPGASTSAPQQDGNEAGMQEAPPTAAANAATVYVYRPKHFVGFLVYYLLFVNDRFVGPISNGTNAAVEVPQGTVSVTIYGDYTIEGGGMAIPLTPLLPEYLGEWTALPGCAKLNWQQWPFAPSKDASLCYETLTHDSRTVRYADGAAPCLYHFHNERGEWTSTVPSRGAPTPYCAGVRDAFERLRTFYEGGIPNRMGTQRFAQQFKAEPGRSYYLSFHFHDRVVSLDIVDEGRGPAELKKTKPIKAH